MEKGKLVAILIALVIALTVTAVIIRASNAKYVQVTKTITAYEATEFIPAHTPVQKDQVKEVQVPSSLNGLTTDVAGKSLLTSIMPGNLIYENIISQTPESLKPGWVSVTVPATLATSGDAASGDTVDIYTEGGNNRPATKLVSDVIILGILDAGGDYITMGGDNATDMIKSRGSKVAAAVILMVPAENVQDIVTNAKEPGVHLVRVK